jgi:N-acyl homoserine lactone hydrolase
MTDSASATIQTVLRGRSLASDEGSPGFGAVNLVTTRDPTGAPHRILFDTGHVGRRRALLQALADLGLTTAAIHVVVLSHAHWDHVQNADLFSHAAVLVHAHEPAYAESPGRSDLVTPSWTGALLRQIGVQTVQDGERLADGVHSIHLPGHTAGSMGLTVETTEGLHVLSGDAVSSAEALRRGRCSVVHHDDQQAKASVELVATVADVVWPGHDRPFTVKDNRPGDYLEANVPVEIHVGTTTTVTVPYE